MDVYNHNIYPGDGFAKREFLLLLPSGLGSLLILWVQTEPPAGSSWYRRSDESDTLGLALEGLQVVRRNQAEPSPPIHFISRGHKEEGGAGMGHRGLGVPSEG